MIKLGINRALWIFGVAQWVTILGFAWLANFGKFETITLTEQMMLAAVIGGRSSGRRSGYSGVCCLHGS